MASGDGDECSSSEIAAFADAIAAGSQSYGNFRPKAHKAVDAFSEQSHVFLAAAKDYLDQ